MVVVVVVVGERVRKGKDSLFGLQEWVKAGWVCKGGQWLL